MQTKLIDALRDPGVHHGLVDHVELIETHISWVLLAGEFAYKIKKPLDLGFLDFSTLEKRRYFCEEEVRLNRRTAPTIYLDVIAIGGTSQQPTLDADADAIEYAVRMHRFDVDAGFDHLLAGDRLERNHVLDLARQIAKLHRLADIAPADGSFGTLESVCDPMRGNFDALGEMLQGKMLQSGAAGNRLTALKNWTETQLEVLAPLFEKRRREGQIRECHGDAHLGNVVLIDGRATLFDCIEFSEDLRWIDVISDLAFTVMDLQDRGAPGFAWLLMDEYLTCTSDYEGIRLLPLYIVYRALVRAKVNAYRLSDDDADKTEVLVEINGYLSLAERISRDKRAAVLITMGVSGSGKSWLARRLVERVGMVRMRSDVERKRLHGLAPEDNSESDVDGDLYSAEATERTYRHLVEQAGTVVDSGIPVLIDAANLKLWQRESFRHLADDRGVPFAIVHCEADDNTLRDRISTRGATGGDPSEADLEVLEHQQQTLQPLTVKERKHTLRLDTAGPNSTRRAAHWIEQILRLGK